jgi:acyl-CoA synthetase (NDP forming)
MTTLAESTTTRRMVGQAETAAVLDSVGIRRPREQRFTTAAEAVAFAAELGGPSVLKLVSEQLVHKSDAGAVRLGLADAGAVEAAAAELIALAASLSLGTWELLGQEQLPQAAIEALVGVTIDPVFGPIVVVGPGGRLVELVRQVSVRQCPVTPLEAEQMLSETVLSQALAGYRGDVKWDVPSFAELVAAASRLPQAVDGFRELDLNPVLPDARGSAVAVDARIIVGADDKVAEHRAARQIDALFDARSIVVVGASEQGETKPGNRVLRSLRKHGYDGDVHVLHPRAESVEGYPAVADPALLPGPVDLACLAVPADGCIAVLELLAPYGLRAAVVFSSGFSDSGDIEAEHALRDAAERLGVTLAGPNTVGVIDFARKLHLTFSQVEDLDEFEEGDVAIVAQSGALGGSILTHAWSRGLGISAFTSVGNQASVDVADFLAHFAADDRTKVVALVLEGASDGPRFLRALDDLRDAGKSTVVLKLGTSSVGMESVRSHTGSIAGDPNVYEELMRHHGAAAVDSITGLLDAAALFSLAPPPAGRRVGVLSTSGGACALIADACARHELDVPELSRELRGALDEVLPQFSATRNPIDVTGQVSTDPSLYGRALRVVLDTSEVDAIILMLTTIGDPQAAEIAADIVEISAASDRPILVCWTIAPELAVDGLGLLRRAGIPVFPDPLRAVAALGTVARQGGR